MADDNLNTAAGCRFFLGTKSGADDLAAYEADTYVEVGEIEDAGEIGDTFNPVNFTSLANGRVRKYKGTADAGDQALTLALDQGDAGQAALKVAHKDRSKGDYNVKMTLNDGDPLAVPAVEPTTIYYRAKIMKNAIAVGSADNVVRRNISVAINSEIIEVLPA